MLWGEVHIDNLLNATRGTSGGDQLKSIGQTRFIYKHIRCGGEQNMVD